LASVIIEYHVYEQYLDILSGYS